MVVAGGGVARRLLDTYRPRMACFNDDVQGTGCVTLAAIMAGLRVSGQTLADVRMVVFGAGSAGVGIADQVRDAIATEGGISHDKAAEQIWYVQYSLPSFFPLPALLAPVFFKSLPSR